MAFLVHLHVSKGYMFKFVGCTLKMFAELGASASRIISYEILTIFRECPVGAIALHGPWDLICKLPKLVVGTNVLPDQ